MKPKENMSNSPPPTSSNDVVHPSLSATRASLNLMDYQKHLDMSAAAMYDFKSHPMAAYPAFPGLAHLPPSSDRNGHMMMRPYHSSPQQAANMYDYTAAQMAATRMSPVPKSPSPPPRIYKPCVVCNDKSSGYHYGVSSCEGCKGFFRRSVQKNIQYTCQKDSNCEINKVTRNRCQHCRLKKCFEKGMSKEAVRNDRKKKTAESSDSKDTANNNNTKHLDTGNVVTDRDRELIAKILDAHRSTLPGGPLRLPRKGSSCPSPMGASPVPSTCSNATGESADNKPSPDTTTIDSLAALNSPGTPSSSLGSPIARPGWENVHELNSEGIVKVVEFAKKIPSFLDLSVSDQITLLKASCLEIMILRLTMRFNLEEETLTFSNGTSVTMLEMEKGGFGPIAPTIFRFSTALHEMELDEKEFALLSVICLLSSDRSGLENSVEVERVQEPYLEALRHYTRKNHPGKPHLFAKLLMKLTDLRSISIKGADKVLHLRQDSSDNIPPLVVEMFDRAENVYIP